MRYYSNLLLKENMMLGLQSLEIIIAAFALMIMNRIKSLEKLIDVDICSIHCALKIGLALR